ncbi:hypothetical protein [Hydrogenivirga sp. 128-5-R1-1]|uniref:hypothetical protein n=1 Tax=Hydrogenivirga sp. 128-5-R1-1 TaxID=392423 RepID=UPI00015F181F|nr:hypothetical protein [Hydrogenivirga sp. 128-5-R1-1]EDP76263.1 hypothetical protein HG1285_18874 [Hydrogenivirga sp. 128-5-R1-1]
MKTETVFVCGQLILDKCADLTRLHVRHRMHKGEVPLRFEIRKAKVLKSNPRRVKKFYTHIKMKRGDEVYVLRELYTLRCGVPIEEIKKEMRPVFEYLKKYRNKLGRINRIIEIRSKRHLQELRQSLMRRLKDDSKGR